MSKAYKCDRCGALYEHDFQLYLHSYFVSKDCHPQEDLELDLCPACQKDLERWVTYPTRIKINKEKEV